MRRAWVVVLGAACASCTLLVSTSGLVGEGGAQPGGDGGPGGEAAAPSDGAVGDGAGDGGSLLGCDQPNVILCDDFERADGLGPWAESHASDDGTVGTTTTDARRGTRSLRGFTSGADRSGKAFYGIPYGKVATKRVEARFALRILGNGSAGTVGQVNTLSIRKGSDNFNVYIHVQDYGVYLAEQAFPNGAAGEYVQHELPRIVQGGPWQDIVVTLTIGSAGTRTRLRVVVDGIQALEEDSEIEIPSGAVSAVAGIGYQGGHPRSEVLVDDYVLVVE